MRWRHPELGMISPGEFIPLFERNGLIHIVDEYVWKEAARHLAIWRDRYGVDLAVSVNVSRMEVFDPELENHLLAILETNELAPKNLKLEITESAPLRPTFSRS